MLYNLVLWAREGDKLHGVGPKPEGKVSKTWK